MINPTLSAPSPNLIMKPGTAPADLHRILDATGQALYTDELSASGLGEAGNRARFNPVKITHAHPLQMAGDGPVFAE